MAKQFRWTHAKPLARANAILQGSILLRGPDPEKNYIHRGEIFVPTPEELRDFGDRIEEVKEKEK